VQLELRHLRVLCAIADAGSLSRAAARLGISQPSLTGQLRRIETALGGEVFRRGRLGVTPTAFGLFVLNRARSALFTVDELLIGADRQPETSGIRIGGYATPVLTGLLNRLFAMPGVRVTVHTEYSPRLLLDLLASRRVDAATLVDYPGHELPAMPTVGIRVVATESISVALPAAHRLAHHIEIPLAELSNEDWLVSPPDGAGWPEVFYAACQEAGFAPRILYMTSEHDIIRAFVREGRAIAPCQSTTRASGVVVRPLIGPALRMRHLFAWRIGGPLADRVAELTELAAEAHREAIADCPDYQFWLTRDNSDVMGARD
jgi:DNA-binding transcriptional LysR family regulator